MKTTTIKLLKNHKQKHIHQQFSDNNYEKQQQPEQLNKQNNIYKTFTTTNTRS